jgi:hypothetical protein
MRDPPVAVTRISDDPYADIVGEYSLTEARYNFLEHVLMFPRDDPRFHYSALSGARAMQAKRAIMDACDRMRDAGGPDQLAELWSEVAEQEAILDEELEREP